MKKITLLSAAMLIPACSFVNASRQGRMVYMNPSQPISVGLLYFIPISLAIPSFSLKSGRSLRLQELVYEDDEIAEALYWDTAYKVPLKKLSAYFAHLELFSMGCQERLLCELAAEPETFTPIAEIFLKEIRPLHGPVKRSPNSLMWRYMLAMRKGFTAPIEACGTSYPKCPLPAKKILNMPVLKVWQFLASKFNMRVM
ncbi:uncharacterized protein LOC135213258 [Macrobrachium nipponense]|uniref:uncharacterized protein LOC135213258 n=1 Tax=Macrobrachium nipponense TaxID=159736 RepID=UPI0030C89F67